MSAFWNLWVIVLTVITFVGTTWILFANRKIKREGDSDEIPTTGHNYDGIEEYDNPLPSWWFTMFVVTLVFSVVYLVLYPGMGNFKGVLGWTSVGSFEKDVAAAKVRFQENYSQFENLSIEDLSKNSAAMKMGKRLFSNNCAVCHGSTAEGSAGFPNLTDSAWLFGGNPDQILHSIKEGRKGAMPPWEAALSETQVTELTAYVRNMGSESLSETEQNGQKTYTMFCLACHGPTGDGNPMLGAPNLKDDVWLYGSSEEAIKESILKGRQGVMPAHKDLISEEKIKLLTAYVYSLSN